MKGPVINLILLSPSIPLPLNLCPLSLVIGEQKYRYEQQFPKKKMKTT